MPPENSTPPSEDCTDRREKKAAYDAVYRAANREKRAVNAAAYYAAHREERLAYSYEHREEKRAYNAAYYAKNREEILASKVVYRATHREEVAAYIVERREERAVHFRTYRARKKGNGGTHTATDIKNQHAYQKGQCFYCGVKVGDDYHVDHVVPLVLGGSNGKENIVIACPTCNLSKNAKHPMDYAGIMF